MINSFFTIGSKPNRPNRFYRETLDQSEPPNSKGMKPIETMKDLGFHMGKIDRASLSAIEEFGIKIKPSTDKKGLNGVELNGDSKFDLVAIDPKGKMTEYPNQPVMIDSDTSKIEAANTVLNGIKILGVKLNNKDGSQEILMFAKNPQNSEKNNVAGGTFDLGDLYKIDTITHNLEGKSSKEQFPGESKKVFEKAKNMGIKLEYDNSRSNGINMLDKNGASVGHIRVFMNQNWKQELVSTLDKVVK